MSLKVTIITSFPEMFPGPLAFSLCGKALDKKIWSLNTINIKHYGIGKHKKIDDTMYGGGAGLIIRPDVIENVIESNNLTNKKIFYPSPRGRAFSQKLAYQISQEKEINILCGRFEGIDERILQYYNFDQISLGDYVLSNGEIAAMTILDTIIRLVPGVVSNQDSINNDSFSIKFENNILLEYPLYTRPCIWKNICVPSVLLSGNDKKIAEWKKNESLRITKTLRPDLLEK